MLLEAVYHRPKQNWSYAYDFETIHIRLKTKRDDMDKVQVLAVDKWDFNGTKIVTDMVKFASNELFDFWEAAVRPPFKRLAYAFILQSGNLCTYMNERGFTPEMPVSAAALFEFPYINPIDVFTPPAWVKDAVFYQIFPERFANGDPSNDPEGVEPWGGKPTRTNFFGGDLQGVINNLDHLEELGVNAIYFNPVFEATTNHKYDTQDYLKVDPNFGDNETLKRLVQECHKRGIRVLLDAVFNHCGATFPPYLDVKSNGAASRYADWFHVREFPLEVRDGIPTYETFSFEPIMPKLNTEHPEVKEYLLNVARYWIEEIGIDGWRLDVADEVDHAFWRDFRKVVKSANPEAYILGEIWHDSMMWLQGDQFDAVMNYPFTDAVLDFFTNRGTLDGARFANAIGSILSSYPQQVNEAAFNLLGSHDTPRLLTICGDDKQRMRLATLFLFTFIGTPCVYYGDEFGINGEMDPDCRKCMEWDESKQDRELFEHYRSIIRLRREHEVLRNGEFRFLHAEKNDKRLAYERFNDASHFIIAANADEVTNTLEIILPQGTWTEAFTGSTIESDGDKTSLKLLPFSYQVFQRTL
ncbi:Cyclomaltodextrinase [Paenibacillus plantiphilus]|uniref:Cyclomaltodextrinase n=1 Tax=Paenibacillus plantiphilus TaxID=2905650 RepID=A0ABM9BNJ7_9BACL|nr:alpha-glycosidase [Paenibacillus plantiphilus]CAH1190061.1 Cyclomaltodextrinase [Paenibacillus plantiphilus]